MYISMQYISIYHTETDISDTVTQYPCMACCFSREKGNNSGKWSLKRRNKVETQLFADDLSTLNKWCHLVVVLFLFTILYYKITHQYLIFYSKQHVRIMSNPYVTFNEPMS